MSSLVVKRNASVAKIKNNIQYSCTESETVKVPKNEGIAVTANALNVLEPKILPRAIQCFHFKAAFTEIVSSGKLVPKAITKRPITHSLTPKVVAILEALSTVK